MKMAMYDDDDTPYGKLARLLTLHLAALYPAMFLESGGREVAPPDPQAGLYIEDRHGNVHQVGLAS